MEYTKQAVAGYTQSVAVPVIAELMRVEYTSPGIHGMESRGAQDRPHRRIFAVR